MKGKCGHETDRLYRLPNEEEWLCEDCIIEKCDMVHDGHLESWTEEDMARDGIER